MLFRESARDQPPGTAQGRKAGRSMVVLLTEVVKY